MPTYDYRCKACGHEFEHFQSITAPTLKKCPKCGKPKLERLIGTGAGIIFKGSGFYETDYRSDSYHKAAKADKEAAKPAEVKTDSGTTKSEPAKTDTPAAKSDKSDTKKPEPAAKPAPAPDKKKSKKH